MPFLAPLIPMVLSALPEIGSALGAITAPLTAAGGILAGPLAGVGTALGIPSAIATPLAGFLSPELIGGGLGEAFGGTKGLEEGLLAGATMGGGLGSLGDLIGTGLNAAGAPGLADMAINAGQAGGLGATALNAANPFIQSAINGMPSQQVASPSKTITPPATTAGVGAAPPGGPSGTSLTGNTAPQVGPWLSNFWNPSTPGGGMPGSTGNVGSIGSAAPATSQAPSANNQQQMVSP